MLRHRRRTADERRSKVQDGSHEERGDAERRRIRVWRRRGDLTAQLRHELGMTQQALERVHRRRLGVDLHRVVEFRVRFPLKVRRNREPRMRLIMLYLMHGRRHYAAQREQDEQ